MLLRFDEFMELALYHPETGYYRRARDPFGKRGDFYTAAQVQPAFGDLIASVAERLAPGATVYDLGAGRQDMASAFRSYVSIDRDRPMPREMSGFVLANEFFDALPVRAGVVRGEQLIELFVDVERITWVEGAPFDAAAAHEIRATWPYLESGARFEYAEQSLCEMDAVAGALQSGFLLIVDYGYTANETRRFPEGTLMAYRNHVALGSILQPPGTCDLTAHVAFEPLIARAVERDFQVERFELLRDFTLREWRGEGDRLRWKSLIYGMGETFRALLLRKKLKSPDCSGLVKGTWERPQRDAKITSSSSERLSSSQQPSWLRSSLSDSPTIEILRSKKIAM